MQNSRLFVGLLAAVILLGAEIGHAHDSFEISYAGASSLQYFFMPEMSRLFFDDTEIRIRLEGGNTDQGIQALQRGEVDMAGATRHLSRAEKAGGLIEHLLGWDVMTAMVNRNNPVQDITLRQLQGIFSGEIVNWLECGGPNLPIIVITCPKGTTMRMAVQELVLQDKAYLDRAVVSVIAAQTDRHVAMFPGAIAVLSTSIVDGARVKALKVDGVEPSSRSLAEGRYPLARPLALITRGAPRDELEVFTNLATSPMGQEVLAKHFVPFHQP